MIEARVVRDRHYTVPLTDEEYKDVKRQALESELKVKQWVGQAVREKLNKKEKTE